MNTVNVRPVERYIATGLSISLLRLKNIAAEVMVMLVRNKVSRMLFNDLSYTKLAALIQPSRTAEVVIIAIRLMERLLSALRENVISRTMRAVSRSPVQ